MSTVEEIAASLSAEQKRNLEEVATLMLEIFRTLQRMAYLEEEWIQPGPHNDAINALMPLYQSLEIDPAVIYLYSILPYIDPLVTRQVDFFDAGTFVDYRNEDDVKEGRDPVFCADIAEGNKMPPWATVLSKTGNHTNVIFYDAKRHRIGIFEYITEDDMPRISGDMNIDVGQCTLSMNDDGTFRRSMKALDGATVDIEDDEEFHRLEEEWRARQLAKWEGQEEFEYNLDRMMVNESRPAPDVLRDINRWYVELVNAPGAEGSNSGQYWNAEVMRPLWRKHGWPGEDFDREAFLVDHQRAYCREMAVYRAEEPLRVFRPDLKPEFSEELQEDLLARIEAANAAGNVDEEWALRWERWWESQEYQSSIRYWQEKKETAERLCPNGVCIQPSELPLWELRQVQLEFYHAQRCLPSLKSDEPSADLRHQRRKLAILEKAVAACEGDVSRLCPGKTPFPIDILARNGHPGLREMAEKWSNLVQNNRNMMEAIREWMGQLPEGAERAKRLAQVMLDRTQKNMEMCSRRSDGYKTSLDKLEREL